jgi:hypothetical protein
MPRADVACFQTDHNLSKLICGAFARGSDARVARPGEPLADVSVVYGILRGCDKVIRLAESLQKDFLHIDLGYFRRSEHAQGDFSGYYRVSWNAFQYGWPDEGRIYPPERWRRLKIPLQQWKKDGKHVVLVPPSMPWGNFIGVFPPQWVESVKTELAKHTDREILVANKDSAPLHTMLRDAWAVVVHNSNAALDALVEGVPVFTLGDSAAWPMGLDDLSRIEKPARDADRERFFRGLACQQWSLEEFADGTAWKMLNER